MYYPLSADISQNDILIVGGGSVAARRVHTLLAFDARITVIAPEVTEELSQEADGQITVRLRAFEEGDIDGRDFVLAATDDAALNAEIAGLCRERGIPVNISSDPSLCDFQFPSVVIDENVVVGINASGTDHKRVKETRQKIEDVLSAPSVYDETKE